MEVETGAILEDSALTTSNSSDEVVYLGSNAVRLGPRKQFFKWAYIVIYVIGPPVLCGWLTIAGHLRFVVLIGTLFGLQRVFLFFRNAKRNRSVVVDDAMKSRISPPLKELCGVLDLPLPHVTVKQSPFAMAMTEQNRSPTLWISTDFLETADDATLRAVIAHELIHQKHRDSLAMRKRVIALIALEYFVWLTVLLDSRSDKLIYFALFLVFIDPVTRLLLALVGFTWRHRETRADLDGVAASRDPDAMIRGLTLASDLRPTIRRMFYGRPQLRWLFFPYSLPPTTHPSIEERVSAINAFPLNENRVDLSARQVDRFETLL